MSKTLPAPAAPWLGDHDLHLFHEGSHVRLYDKFGAHPTTVAGVAGTQFTVWAPAARYVSVVGDFNSWDRGANPLQPVGVSGCWGGFFPGDHRGKCYKFHVASR